MKFSKIATLYFGVSSALRELSAKQLAPLFLRFLDILIFREFILNLQNFFEKCQGLNVFGT